MSCSVRYLYLDFERGLVLRSTGDCVNDEEESVWEVPTEGH